VLDFPVDVYYPRGYHRRLQERCFDQVIRYGYVLPCFEAKYGRSLALSDNEEDCELALEILTKIIDGDEEKDNLDVLYFLARASYVTGNKSGSLKYIISALAVVKREYPPLYFPRGKRFIAYH